MKIDFQKGGGLVPAIIQDAESLKVLMLGYMNEEALARTLEQRRVHFYSRSKRRLWMKGEQSGNVLELRDIAHDCDNDTILIKVTVRGPVCHTGSQSCFGDTEPVGVSFLNRLQDLIESRKMSSPDNSYTAKLFSMGIDRIAQKIGEEATEVVIAAKNSEVRPLLNESADLLFHLSVLLSSRGLRLEEVISILQERSRKHA